MKELTDRELQWLETFAKKHDFFNSFLLHYRINKYLTNHQYYWFFLYINKAVEDGDTLLNDEEISFLESNSEENAQLNELLEINNNRGYLRKEEYRLLLDLQSAINKSIKHEKERHKTVHLITKVPCPHCTFLCSPQIIFCSKCGEPLPKLDVDKTYIDNSEIIDTDYTEKHIIHSLEQQINKFIHLKEKFDMSSTCYTKTNDEITGLSLFKCELDRIPTEIFKLNSIKQLALRRNSIKSLPKEIAFLSNLEYLDLRINNLERLPNSFGLLLKLKNLNLSSNKLMELPDSIGELASLEKLNLSNNRLKGIPSSIFSLNNLKILNLKANFWIRIPEQIEKLEEQGLKIYL